MKKKIVHILKGKANPNTLNGVNKVVHSLATKQFAMGHDVEVWGVTATPSKIPHKHAYALKLFKAKKLRFTIDESLIAAIKTLPKNTVAHLHSVFLPELFTVARQLEQAGIPWVISPHGGYASESLKKNKTIKKIYMYLFEKKLINSSMGIHALGYYGEAEYFSASRNMNKTVIIPNGHEVSDLQKESYATSLPLKLVYCGRIAIPQKGLDVLLRAIFICLKKGISVTLDLIGDGVDIKELKKLAATLEIESCVTFHGAKTGLDKDLLLMSSDVFVHTSRWDGIPMAALEAMALGLPAIVTQATNIGEEVSEHEAGYVSSYVDPENISHQIGLAYRDKTSGLIEKKGKAARKMVTDYFSWSTIAKRMDSELYGGVKC